MVKHGGLPNSIFNFIFLLALAALWIIFAPIQLGGQVSYILVDGTSMLPNFHTGDLAILRKASNYQVGDIITYLDAFTGAPIIHRIIGTQKDRFVVKGDNNSWIDPSQPRSTEILGRLWIHLPKVGNGMLWMRKPVNLAVFTVLLGGLFMLTMKAQKPGKNGKKKRNNSGDSGGTFGLLLTLFGFLGAVFLAMSIFAFTRPVMIKADNIPYKQIANFAYSAIGSPIVYDSGAAASGEPVFTKLTCTLNLGFAYTLQAGNLENISGTRKIDALLQDKGIGWRRTIPVMAEAKFSGNTATSHFSLDLCKVTALKDSVAQVTGVHLGASTLVIVFHITVTGILSGQKFSETFDPTLNFAFDGQQLFLIPNTDGTNSLQTVKSGNLPNLKMINNTIKLFGFNLLIAILRKVGLIGLGICLAGLVGLGLYYSITSRRDPETIIRIKYGSMIVDVTRMDDLAKLAERQNSMIMHLTHEDVHYYLIQVDGKTYRYAYGQDLKIL